MALESVSAAETFQSTSDNDLEDGEIPSDEDDDLTIPCNTNQESTKLSPKHEGSKSKPIDTKYDKNKKQTPSCTSKHDRFLKHKDGSEDWAGDVEKAIRAALEEDGGPRNQDSRSRNKNNRNNKNNKKRGHEEKDDRSKDQKKRKLADDENANEDEDEMLFVRGASPIRKDSQSNSPQRHSNERESFDSNSDYEDRTTVNRHRENENKRGSGRGAGRRGGKNERGGKNKGRGQMRNDRNGRRNQNDQDLDAICVYYMQGKCHRGDDCPYSHNALPPRKMELCKFYLMDCCAKRDKCLYMHHDFPCKFFHTGLKCLQGDNCKFSHQPLSEQVKGILLKHLETAPKEILGDFPRLSREGAMIMINNTAKSLAQGQDASSQKIPSLFDLNLTAPIPNPEKSLDKDDNKRNNLDDSINNPHKILGRDRKPSGKKTRWGSDEDRVPFEQIMLIQSTEFNMRVSNAGVKSQQKPQQKQTQQDAAPTLEFYTETNTSNSNKAEDFTKDVEEDEILAEAKKNNAVNLENSKDVDLRQLLSTNKKPPVVSIADRVANLTKSKDDEESDQDEEADLVIEIPEEDKDKEKNLKRDDSTNTKAQNVSLTVSPSTQDSEVPSHLPKKTQELFLRIQQQQRAAQDSLRNMDDENLSFKNEEMDNWYSDEDDDDDDEGGNLTIVLSGKETGKEESETAKTTSDENDNESSQPVSSAQSIPQPAAIVDKLGDLSKIDISAEVSKLLSSIKAQSSISAKSTANQSNTNKKTNDSSHQKSTLNKESNSEDYNPKNQLSSISGFASSNQVSKVENETSSPQSSPGPSSTPSLSRDPRMSRDPRQRRDEHKSSISPCRESKRESKHLTIETSIYSSGITPIEANMDTDLRTRTDQDLRRKDMDFRQRFQTGFGDTDLRVVNTNFANTSGKSDIDLRQMLSLPFKPVPSLVPCSEIDASISSHPQMSYKVYVVDIPRPDYTGLNLTRNDPKVTRDPRLRKIFRVSEIADSPMSPPPVKIDTPKSPPHAQIRADPRRKALELCNQSSQNMNASMISASQQPMEMGSMNLGPPSMSNSSGMSGSQGYMMGNMGGMGSMMNAPMTSSNMPPMGMGSMSSVGSGMSMNGPVMPQNQLNYDPRFNSQRNNGAGLLGPAPGMGFGPDSYDVPNPGPRPGPGSDHYANGNFNNFVPGPGPPDPGMMPFNPNGPNYNMDGPDWNTGNPIRRGGRIRRRNRNRTNMLANN